MYDSAVNAVSVRLSEGVKEQLGLNKDRIVVYTQNRMLDEVLRGLASEVSETRFESMKIYTGGRQVDFRERDKTLVEHRAWVTIELPRGAVPSKSGPNSKGRRALGKSA